jgi:hypothetical protein
VSRIFLSHSGADWREAVALKALAEQDPPLANEIFLDLDPGPGSSSADRMATMVASDDRR